MKTFEQVLEDVRNVKISDIISRRIDIRRNGSEYETLCPFHNDDKYGSFKINNAKGIYKCFSCGEGGDGIDFVKNYDSVSWKKAVLTIAVESEIISKEEYKVLLGSKYDAGNLPVKHHIEKESGVELADTDILNYVYGLVSKGLSLYEGESKLSDEHLQYLNKRGLSDEDIESTGYFTFPDGRGIAKITKAIRQRGLDVDEILTGVPGFYKDIEKNRWKLATQTGIGIPIRSALNDILAIQIRADKVTEGSSRYRWLSSTFVYDTKHVGKLDLGCSPGTPIDVHYAKNASNVLFITEGHFKAKVIAKTLRSTCLSVQGITTWRENLLPAIEDVRGNLDNGITRVYIAFDADMAYNFNVVQQMIAMSDYIAENIEDVKIYFVLWDEELGKGIDDMIENGHVNKLKKLPASMVKEAYQKLLDAKGCKDLADLKKVLPKESLQYYFKSEILPKASRER